MDLFDFDAMKVKNTPTSVSWFNHLPTLTKLFRWIEFCLAMLLLSWIFNRLPFLLRISGDYFRQIAGVIACPLFVFLLCNAIILTLILKSDRFSGENPAADNAETQLYQQFLKNNKNSFSKPLSSEDDSSTPQVEFQDKEIISQLDNVIVMEKSLVSDSDSDTPPKVYRRWKSEKLERKEKETMKLRRSETEKFMDKAKSRVENGDVLSPGEELSAEEFQRAVDDFIAKHLKLRRQESLDVVLQPSNPDLNFQN